MPTDLLTFLGVAVVVIVTPGPDTALTIRNALLGGRVSGTFTAAGVAGGQLVWTFATSAGIAALLVASEPAFTAVRLAGAAYLVFLGVQALVAAWRPSKPLPVSTIRGPGRSNSWAAFRQGLLSNLVNPKMAVFFTSLLPQFTPGGRASFGALCLLGALFALLTLVWLTAYAFAVARAGDWLRRPSIRRALEGITGAVLVALGLRLAAAHRD
jgi:threonine/homoserine/homoserine lactone efflux protein